MNLPQETACGSGADAQRQVVVGVTAGIAAYKTAELVSRLVRAGLGVQVVMTPEAVHLVGPRTFQALTGRQVLVDMWREGGVPIPHITPGRGAELLCVAPATANILAKAAAGIADDLLSTFILAFDGPVFYAPAMNPVMWRKPAVQRNVRQLADDGAVMIGPETGRVACGDAGEGRMAEPQVICERILTFLDQKF